MPDKLTDIIDFSQNYYDILGIDPIDLPTGKDPNSRRHASNILREVYHKKLFEVHPDRPDGDEEKFKLVVRAHHILSDPILREFYDNGGNEIVTEHNGSMRINWSRLGKYRKGSLADMIGTAIFEKIINESGIEKIQPKLVPSDESVHNYHWEFFVEDLPKELVLSIVEDENEVLRLTSGDDFAIDQSLPFKIYICLPSIKMVMVRDDDIFVETSSGYLDLIKGKIQNAGFIDADILGTTNYDKAVDFIISGELKNAVNECINGNINKFLKEYSDNGNAETNSILNQNDVNKIDQEQLKKLMEMN